MRLLFVSHTFPPLNRPLANVGGMQRVATELHDALYRNADLQLHSLTLRSSWRWLAVQTPLFLFRSLLQLERLSQHRQIDAVLFSSLLSAAFILPFARHLRACGAITAAIAHGQDVTGLYPGYQSLVRQGLRRLDQVVSVSRATGQACVERGLEEARLQVIPNGVDLRRFPPHPQSTAARRRLQSLGELPADAFLLVSVGRHVARKGFLWFVEQVMPLLPDNIHYWLAGRGPDSSKILHAAACRGLSSRVHLVGPLGEKELLWLYSGADLFIMPNILVPGTMEGFGIVMLEAGMCGLPTVAARIEGICDVIVDGRNGALVESGQPAAFVQAILRYYHNRLLLPLRSRHAYRHARQFGWTAIAGRYVELLEQLVSRRAMQPCCSCPVSGTYRFNAKLTAAQSAHNPTFPPL